MNNNVVLSGLVMLLVGVGIGYALNWEGYRESDTHMMQGGRQMMQGIDQHFIDQMIPHHEGAIEMARVALARSKRTEIITLAQNIIAAQEAEIKDMRAWHIAWFGGEPQKYDSHMHMDGMEGDISQLNAASDTAFDREFINQMVPHHEMAVMMAEMLAAATDRPEMKQLAQNIITSQSEEIEMMRGWRSAWYGN